jgi:hypothetical protein
VQGANDPNVTPENLRVLYQRLIEFFGAAFAD